MNLAMGCCCAFAMSASILAGSSSHAEPVGRRVEIWTREPGNHDRNPHRPRGRLQRFDLAAGRSMDVVRMDPQYGSDQHYRGVELVSLIQRYEPPPEVDTAILHFANGMAVPVPFRDRAVMAKIDAFVVIARRAAPGKGAWQARLPSIPKPGAVEDVRPITFGGNKIAVQGRWHPMVPAAAEAVFSPWLHVDTLTGIELVRADAYYRQFDVEHNPAAEAGLQRFKESCQFCHGAHQNGAKFGWDLVDPIPLYKLRKQGLGMHVRNREPDAARRGLMMPPLTYLSAKDIGDLWTWLQAVGTKPLEKYSP
jgi:mono/diheme cytochrome c family protein